MSAFDGGECLIGGPGFAHLVSGILEEEPQGFPEERLVLHQQNTR
jgi:hypothetical protein